MKARIIRIMRKLLRILNRCPFWNALHLRGTKLTCKGATLVRCKIDCKGKNNVIVAQKNALLTKCRICIRGDNNVVHIGENVHVKCGEFYIEDSQNRIEIGDNSSLCGQIHLACTEGTKILIGQKCLFSSEIVFRTGDSHSILSKDGSRINFAQDITIADHVWLGHRVLINKGVRIEKDSVVGTGSVVTKQFTEPNVVIAGVPAKVVKTNTSWCGERIGKTASPAVHP